MSQSVMSTYQRMDVGFVSGQGPWLVDERGERYLDALSGIAVCGLGHAHPRIAQVVAEQAARLVHTSNLIASPCRRSWPSGWLTSPAWSGRFSATRGRGQRGGDKNLPQARPSEAA